MTVTSLLVTSVLIIGYARPAKAGDAVMKGNIFISYRREDTRAEARSIYTRLQGTFGTKKLFMDVDTIAHGRDFRKVIEAHLADSAVLLVLIGPNWLGTGRNAQDRRIDDLADFVRTEVASGLRRDVPVIPILIEGAQMPSAADLPDEISGRGRHPSQHEGGER
jgi:hypothetical protein